MMKKSLMLFFCAVSIAFGQESGRTRLLTPRADSPTAMRRCGAELESVKAERGLNTRYVFTGNEVLHKMQYCVTEAGGVVRIANVAYRVPAGTVGWTNSEGTEVVLEECINGAECEGCNPPASPPPPATVVVPPPFPSAPQPVPEQPKAAPPGLPTCLVNGSPESGFNATAYNGEAVLFVDGEAYITGAALPANPGIHTFEARISGLGGPIAVCKRTWEVPVPFSLQPPEEEEERGGYCDDGNPHHWYGWPRVQVQCHPVRTTAIICGTTFAASLITHVPIPPCGWFRHQQPASPAPIKPAVPGAGSGIGPVH